MWPLLCCLLLKVESQAGLAWLKQAPGPAGGMAVCKGCSKAAAQPSQPQPTSLCFHLQLPYSLSEQGLPGPHGGKAALPLPMDVSREPEWHRHPF